MQQALVLAKNDPEAASYIGHVKSHIPAISQYIAKTIQALDSFNPDAALNAADEVSSLTEGVGILMKYTKEAKKLFNLGSYFYELTKTLAYLQKR